MTDSVTPGGGRARIVAIETRLSTGRALHFCGHPVLSGANHDLWFPLADGESLFQAAERIMVMNHQAVNVTRIERLAEHDGGADWALTYNAPAEGVAASAVYSGDRS